MYSHNITNNMRHAKVMPDWLNFVTRRPKIVNGNMLS